MALTAAYLGVKSIENAYQQASQKEEAEQKYHSEKQARVDDEKRHKEDMRQLDLLIAKTNERNERWRQSYYKQKQIVEGLTKDDPKFKEWAETKYPSILD